MAIKDYFPQFGPDRAPVLGPFAMPAVASVQQEVSPAVQPAPRFALPAMPTNPLLDPNLYTPVAPRVQKPFDFGQFAMPEAPRFQMPEALPQRNIGMERQRTGRQTLRSALLGALLGGGVGAIAAGTGTQEAMQQAYDQEYNQRIADYQQRMRALDLQNQQEQARYNRQLAERGVRVGEATQAYDAEGRRMAAEDQADEAQRIGRLGLAAAKYNNDIQQYNRVKTALDNISSIDPADQVAYMNVAYSGDLSLMPPGGFRKAPTFQTPTTGTAIFNAVTRFLDMSPYLQNDQFNNQRDAMLKLVKSSSDPSVRELANLIPAARPTGAITYKAKQGEMRQAEKATALKQGQSRVDLDRRAKAETERHNRAMEGIRNRSLEVDAIHKQWTRNKESNPQAKFDINSRNKVIDQFKLISKEIAASEKKLSEDIAMQNVPELAAPIRKRIAEARSNLQLNFVKRFSDVFDFGGIESGIPTITPKRQASTPKPNAPTGGSTADGFITIMVEGKPVKYRIKK